MKKQDLSTSLSETSENLYLFVFVSWLVSFGICIYTQCFFDVWIFTRVNEKKINWVQEKNMSCGHALNFD